MSNGCFEENSAGKLLLKMERYSYNVEELNLGEVT